MKATPLLLFTIGCSAGGDATKDTSFSYPTDGSPPDTETTPVVPPPVTTPPPETADTGGPSTSTTPTGDTGGCATIPPPTVGPIVFNGGPFGGFQSVPGTGFQTTITFTFACPITHFEVTILDPDYVANEIVAYHLGLEVARVAFVGDGAPGVYTTDLQAVDADAIDTVELVPDPIDYVAYSGAVWL